MAADNGHPAGVNQPDVLSTTDALEASAMPAATVIPRSGRRKTAHPSFQFYPGDFLADGDQMAMSLEEVGAYIRLLSHAWIKGGLPNDVPKLSRMVGGTPPVVETVLREHFVLSNDIWRNPRQERERDRLAKYKKQASLAGQRSAEVRSTGVQRAFNGRSTDVQRNANTSASASASVQIPTVSGERTAPHTPSKAFIPHRGHALCGRICLPVTQFREFVRLKGGTPDDAGAYVSDWARRIIAEWDVGGANERVAVGDTFAFWRERWKQDHATPRAVVSKTAGNMEAARRFLEGVRDAS